MMLFGIYVMGYGIHLYRSDVPILVQRVLDGELRVDQYITHTFKGVDKWNDAVHALHSGDCLRAVVEY
jgi:S-(hydroxymethyl)glutathione dehydrogenase/alcohol dehydrogenase